MRFIKGKFTGYHHIIGVSGKNENAEMLTEYFYNGTKPLLWEIPQKKRRFSFAVPSEILFLILSILISGSLTFGFIYLLNQNLFFNELSIIKNEIAVPVMALSCLIVGYFVTYKTLLYTELLFSKAVRSKILCFLNLHKHTLSDTARGIAGGTHCSRCKATLIKPIVWPKPRPRPKQTGKEIKS